MEREIEQKMRDLFPSYSGIHQPKNERQPNFHGNYSTFFVRFDDENDAKVRLGFLSLKLSSNFRMQKFIFIEENMNLYLTLKYQEL